MLSASFEKLLHDHGHYLDDLYIITVRYVNPLGGTVRDGVCIEAKKSSREYKR